MNANTTRKNSVDAYDELMQELDNLEAQPEQIKKPDSTPNPVVLAVEDLEISDQTALYRQRLVQLQKQAQEQRQHRSRVPDEPHDEKMKQEESRKEEEDDEEDLDIENEEFHFSYATTSAFSKTP